MLPSPGAVCYGTPVLPEVPNVWDRYPGELPGDYALFLRYLEQGVARTVANTQRLAHQGEGSGYTYSYVLQLSRAWFWAERAEAYDAVVVEQRKEAFVKLEAEKIARWNHDQLELAELAKQIARSELIAIIKRQEDGQPLSGAVLTRLLDTIHKWQQISVGGKTDDIGLGIDLSRLSAEAQTALQTEAVREALAQIAKG